MSIFRSKVDKTWTLFLDRDGVINRRPLNDYVKTPESFEFLPGVLHALKILSKIVGRIIVVTNQQGVGKNLMTVKDLEVIHQKMVLDIERAGGRIDKIYHCTDLAKSQNNCRKPGTKMAQQAKTDFPEIDFKKSIMAGDTKTDMEFGRNTGMKTILINTNNSKLEPALFDTEFPDLITLAKSLVAND